MKIPFQNYRFLFLLFVPVLLISCDEYSSPVPAGKLKESVIDTLYTGGWLYVGRDYEVDSSTVKLEPHYLNILPFDDHRYVIQMMKKDSVRWNNIPDAYEATTCRLGGKNIVSVRLLSPKEGATEYLIYVYGIRNDTLWYHGLQKSKLDKQFDKTPALKKYLLEYLNDTSVFLPARNYVRVKAE